MTNFVLGHPLEGEMVVKDNGDYYFMGVVTGRFYKIAKGSLKLGTGALRVVVQNRDGVVHIFNPMTQLRYATAAEIVSEEELWLKK
jgi:hypothetical protein